MVILRSDQPLLSLIWYQKAILKRLNQIVELRKLPFDLLYKLHLDLNLHHLSLLLFNQLSRAEGDYTSIFSQISQHSSRKTANSQPLASLKSQDSLKREFLRQLTLILFQREYASLTQDLWTKSRTRELNKLLKNHT